MTPAKRIMMLMVAAGLSVAVATAQEIPLADPGDVDMPGEVAMPGEMGAPLDMGAAGGEMPSMGPDNAPSMHLQDTGEQSMLVEPGQSSVDSCEECNGSAYDLWDMESVPIESSGTWLRRGLWFAEADVVVMNRIWSRHDMLLASADSLPPPFSGSNRFLYLRSAHPGEDASLKTTLGRFLFRDERNRDHSVELTTYIGGDWVIDNALDSTNGQLQVPFPIDGNNRSFDFSNRQTVLYSSRFNSFELNYHVQRRMRRDQMAMDPDGHWRRQASPGVTHEYYAGVRYLELSEILDWRAEDLLLVPGDDGTYLIQTDNDLIGLQIGGGETYETDRWSVGFGGKAGTYVNDASARSQLDFTSDDLSDFDQRRTEDQLSFIGEAWIQAKWHFTPNFSLRTGIQILYITSVALAPNQADFISESKELSSSGDPFYQGASVGFEGYW